MNILIAIETLKTGGAEKFAKNLAVGLSKGNSVYILLTSFEIDDNYPVLPGVKLIYPINLPIIRQLKKHFYFFVKVQYVLQWIQFRFILLWNKIDVVHSHLYRTDFKILKWLGGKKLPWIIGMHGCYEDYLFTKENTISQNDLMRMEAIFRRVNFVSLASKKNRTVFDYTKVIPRNGLLNYGFDNANIKPKGDKRGSTWVIGVVSRGIESKGWQQAIESFLLLLKSMPEIDAELRLIYSVTPYMNQLEQVYSRESRIKFVGHKHNVISEMCEMDVLLFPSYFASESQPVTIIESLAVGLPVVGTDIGEIKQMIGIDSNPSGFCVKRQINGQADPMELFYYLKQLITNKELYQQMQLNAIKNFDPFNINRCVDNYMQLYKQLIMVLDHSI